MCASLSLSLFLSLSIFSLSRSCALCVARARSLSLSLSLFERHHRSSRSCMFVCTHSFAYSWTMQQRREWPSSRLLQDKVGRWNSEPSNRCVTSFVRLRALGCSWCICTVLRSHDGTLTGRKAKRRGKKESCASRKGLARHSAGYWRHQGAHKAAKKAGTYSWRSNKYVHAYVQSVCLVLSFGKQNDNKTCKFWRFTSKFWRFTIRLIQAKSKYDRIRKEASEEADKILYHGMKESQ